MSANAAPTSLPDTAALKAMRIWDLHFHLQPDKQRTLSQQMEEVLPFIDRLGIERLCPFLHVGLGTSRTQGEFKPTYLQEVEGLLSRWPDRLLGFVWLNPNRVKESLESLDRWIKNGPMVGVKFGGGGHRYPSLQSPQLRSPHRARRRIAGTGLHSHLDEGRRQSAAARW